MADWNTRLVIKFTPLGGTESIVSPIDSFSPKIETPHDIIDSIDGENLGFTSKNRRFSFDFTVKAFNTSVMRKLYAVALKQKEFSIGIGYQIDDGEHEDWTFDSMKFEKCRFTSVSPSDVTNEGDVPEMSFSGICLTVGASAGAETVTTNNTVGTGSGDFTQ